LALEISSRFKQNPQKPPEFHDPTPYPLPSIITKTKPSLFKRKRGEKGNKRIKGVMNDL
jgi:hypothetical protein